MTTKIFCNQCKKAIHEEPDHQHFVISVEGNGVVDLCSKECLFGYATTKYNRGANNETQD